MTKIVKPLTDTRIRSAKPKEKEYNLVDGKGLTVRIMPNGTKSWLFNYTRPIIKKRTNLSLGTYPELSLANAREKALEMRKLLAQDIDPYYFREQQRAKKIAIQEFNFQSVSEEWFERKRETVTANHAEKIWSSFQNQMFPYFGNIPISQINAPLVIKAFRPIEAKGNLETVKRLCQRINEVMVYAVNTGLIFANPLSGIKAAFKPPKRQHMLAMKPEELPELMFALANSNIKMVTRFLIEWQLHTMTRPNEAAGTCWSEINIEEKLWVIPAERMKMSKAHIIPLSSACINLLKAIKPITGHRLFVFPADRNPHAHCNVQTANAALKRMGLKDRTTSHGLRSLASTTLNEQGFEWDIVEAALAHVDKNQVRSAYNRASYLDRRREMMEWWSNHIIESAKGSMSLTNPYSIKLSTQDNE